MLDLKQLLADTPGADNVIHLNNAGAKLGMGAAIEYTLALGIDNLWARIQLIADRLRSRLAQIDGVTVRDSGIVKSGIVAFTLDGSPSKEIERLLAVQPRRINVAPSIFRLTMLDMQARSLCDIVRASVHAYNTEQDIETVAQTIETVPVPKLTKQPGNLPCC